MIFFRNLTGGDISVDSMNITAGGKKQLLLHLYYRSTRTDDPEELSNIKRIYFFIEENIFALVILKLSAVTFPLL